MSPGCTSCDISTSPAASTTWTVPGLGDLEGLVVAAVLLGLLRHQADVGDRAHRRGVVGAVLAAVVDDGLVDAGVGAVGDDGEGVGLLAVRAPHVAGGADHGRHRGVDDDVARDVQVGDALVGVDHREPRAVGEALLDRGLDLGSLALGQGGEPVEDRAEAVVGGQARRRRGRRRTVAKTSGRKARDDVAEDDRVGDLHHRGLEVHREEHAVGLGPRRSARRGTRRGRRRCRTVASTTSPSSTFRPSLRTVVPCVGDELDGQGVGGGDDDRLLVGAEVVRAHRGDVGLASRGSRRPSSAGACGRSSSRRRGRGGRSCPRAGRG